MFECALWTGDLGKFGAYADLLSTEYRDSRITSAYLRWKHLDNPLGRSIVALATDHDGRVVAGRAFWFSAPGDVVVAQPCDTVTDVGARRKGLFEKLTRLCLEQCQERWIVLNFPNHNSRPGYLKLGWQVYQTQKKVFSFGVFGPRFKRFENFLKDDGGEFPLELKEYLAWRFVRNPLYSYEGAIYNGRVFVRRDRMYSTFLVGEDVFADRKVTVPSGWAFKYSPISSQGCGLVRNGVEVALDSSSTIAYLPRGEKTGLDVLLHRFDSNFLMDTF